MGSPVFLYLLFGSWSNRGMPACAAIPFLFTHRESSLVAAVAQRIKTWWWAVPSMSLGAPLSHCSPVSSQPLVLSSFFDLFIWVSKSYIKQREFLHRAVLLLMLAQYFKAAAFFILFFFLFALCASEDPPFQGYSILLVLFIANPHSYTHTVRRRSKHVCMLYTSVWFRGQFDIGRSFNRKKK